MTETIWVALLAILLAAALLWLWSARRTDPVRSHPEDKNPIDIES
jgi:HAMP domain-containing protein